MFGLLCNRQGCPVAVEVFDGNTADPHTVGAHIEKLRQRFAFSRVVLVGDRGMLTEARIREEVAPAGLDWISALRAPAIRELMRSGAVQRSMFDETDLAEVRCDAYPGERLIVCRNERLAKERARKREALLQATEALLAPIGAATQRQKRRLSGKETIALRVGKVIGKYKMAKHFELDITETAFAYPRKSEAIAAEAALDGLYIVRTSVPATELDAEHTVRAYKGLSVVERAFRSLKTVDLKVRPIYHYAASRVRAHVFLCMLAYYVEWHMRQRLKPLLFDDEEPEVAHAARTSVVGARRGLTVGPGQGPTQTHRLGRARAQLPHPARRLGHDCQQSRGGAVGRCRAVRPHHSTHRAAAPSLQAARRSAGTYPVTRLPFFYFIPKNNELVRICRRSSD